MTEKLDQTDGIGGRHGSARAMAERAVAAQAAGDDDVADRLFAEAARIDPSAVDAVLSDRARDPDDTSTGTDALPASDEEVAAAGSMAGTPDHAPSRAGITGPGSGADRQAT